MRFSLLLADLKQGSTPPLDYYITAVPDIAQRPGKPVNQARPANQFPTSATQRLFQ
jgi:hypothetical protein